MACAVLSVKAMCGIEDQIENRGMRVG
jgi:hypothetical protein